MESWASIHLVKYLRVAKYGVVFIGSDKDSSRTFQYARYCQLRQFAKYVNELHVWMIKPTWKDLSHISIYLMRYSRCEKSCEITGCGTGRAVHEPRLPNILSQKESASGPSWCRSPAQALGMVMWTYMLNDDSGVAWHWMFFYQNVNITRHVFIVSCTRRDPSSYQVTIAMTDSLVSREGGYIVMTIVIRVNKYDMPWKRCLYVYGIDAGWIFRSSCLIVTFGVAPRSSLWTANIHFQLRIQQFI